MRLTLRTMLAYLDDILDPEDAEDIGKKINESDFATSLMHRTRDCVRRMRLGTPAITGKGLAADPNTVAEYLDNTMEADRVPEFEKVCLESDVHLAELASCHQVLALVLGEPAEIDPASRERMYHMITHAEQQREPVAAPPGPVERTQLEQAAMSPIAGRVDGKRQRPEVPDYLREGRKSRWPIISTVAVAAIVTLAILLVAGPPEFRNMLARLTGQAPVEGPEAPIAMPGDAPNPDAVAPLDADDPATDASPDNPGDVPPAIAPVEPTAPADETPAEAASSNYRPAADLSLPRIGETEEPGTLEAAPMPEETPVETADDTRPAPADTDEPATDETAETAADRPADDNPLRKGDPLDIATKTGVEMGMFMTDNQVALVLDPEQKDWRRIAPRKVIKAGDQVLSMPAFRPEFSLANGVTLQASGPAAIEFEGLDEQTRPVIAVAYGRLTMRTVGKAGNQIHVRIGERDLLLTFADAQSSLALDVVGILVPGRDPESGPPQRAVDLYATSGEILWSDGKEEQSLKAPEHVSLTEVSAGALPQGQVPDWVHRDTTSVIDQQAAAMIAKELKPDRPITLGLKELSQHRRAEVRSLAIRSLGYMGQFDAFTSALNDPDQKASWPAQVESLQAALARGPEVAAQVRKTFEKQRPDDATSLYRMLWGFTGQQLSDGDAERLVDALDHEALDVRVLSYAALNDITGMSLFYRPEHADAKRRAAVQKWKEKLKEGKIVPAGTPPAKVSRKAFNPLGAS